MGNRAKHFLYGNLAAPKAFRFQVNVGVESITLPVTGFAGMVIDYGDGSGTTTSLTKSYTVAGSYTIVCKSDLTGTFQVNNGALKTKITNILEWGIKFTNIDFFGCTNLTDVTVSDILDTSSFVSTGFTSLFRGCSNLTTVNLIDSWDTSFATQLIFSFFGASIFNQSLNSWNVSNVTSLSGCFWNCALFNQSLNSWNVANVSNHTNLFNGCTVFNGNITSWNIKTGANLSDMFANTSAFNQNISTWTVTTSTMTRMFASANAFNQPIGSWAISGNASITLMFNNNTIFNQSLNSWNVSAKTTLFGVFNGATAFNGNITSWNVSAATSLASMLDGTTNFNQDLSGWNVSNATTMNNFGRNSNFSRANYDLMLNAWNLLPLKTGVTLTINAQYTIATSGTARANIISTYGWTIIDGGGV